MEGHAPKILTAFIMQIVAKGKLASQRKISSLSLADGLTQVGSTCRWTQIRPISSQTPTESTRLGSVPVRRPQMQPAKDWMQVLTQEVWASRPRKANSKHHMEDFSTHLSKYTIQTYMSKFVPSKYIFDDTILIISSSFADWWIKN